jgi:hypothetical protein
MRVRCVTGFYGECLTRKVRPDEFQRLGERIRAVRENTAECREAKRILLSLHGQGLEGGRFEFWDGINRPYPGEQEFGYNSSDQNGRILVYDSYWIWRDPYLLVHEAFHTYLNETGMAPSMTRTQQENWISARQIHC